MVGKVTLSGVLLDPLNKPLPGVHIELKSVKTGDVISGLAAEFVTNQDGSYSVEVPVGSYKCAIVVKDRETSLPGYVNVYEYSGAGTLNEYLYAPCQEDGEPMFIVQWEMIRQEIKDYSDSVNANVTEINDILQQIQSIISGSTIFKTVPEGVASTSDGGYFYVIRDASSGIAVDIYQNVGGTGIYQNNIANFVRVNKNSDEIDAINLRTGGLLTKAGGKYFVCFIDGKGKTPFFIDLDGYVNAPKGIKSSSIISDSFDIGKLFASIISGAKTINASQNGPYPLAETDKATGKALFATRKDGTKEYLGEPLVRTRGLVRNRCFFIGDSISANGISDYFTNSDGYKNSATYESRSWHMWASIMSGGRVLISGGSATGGYTTAQIMNIHLPVAIADKPDFCIVMGGRNDVVQGIDIDSVTIPNLKKIYWSLRRAGIIPVLCTMSAQGNSTDDNRRKAEHKINKFIREYASKNKLPLVDLHARTVDPITGDWLAGYNADVSHPVSVGAKVMGQAVIDDFSDWLTKNKPFMAAENLTYPLVNNYVKNPLFVNLTDGKISDYTYVIEGETSQESDSVVPGNVVSMRNSRLEQVVNLTDAGRYAFGFKVKKSKGTKIAACLKKGDSSSTVYVAGIREWTNSIDEYGYYYSEFVLGSGDVGDFTIILQASDVETSEPEITPTYFGQLGIFKADTK